MSHGGHSIRFEAEIIRFDDPGGWHGVFLTDEAAAEARFFGRANALGAIAVDVTIGAAEARTSLFPDKRRQTYLLPLKASLRQTATVTVGDRIEVTLTLIG